MLSKRYDVPADWITLGNGSNDIPDIARGQLSWEDAARAEQPNLLILDTHLLTNKLWSQTLFGDYPAWLDSELLARHYDLHLLLSPDDVEWTADGQRCQISKLPLIKRFLRNTWAGKT